jgi:hypothetical protein
MAFPQHKCTSKCVMMIYCTLLEWSRLANMEVAASFANQCEKSISVIDAVIWRSKAAKQMYPHTIHHTEMFSERKVFSQVGGWWNRWKHSRRLSIRLHMKTLRQKMNLNIDAGAGTEVDVK